MVFVWGGRGFSSVRGRGFFSFFFQNGGDNFRRGRRGCFGSLSHRGKRKVGVLIQQISGKKHLKNPKLGTICKKG